MRYTLLIVPYGIEIRLMILQNYVIMLLIVPYGIEIKYCPFVKFLRV